MAGGIHRHPCGHAPLPPPGPGAALYRAGRAVVLGSLVLGCAARGGDASREPPLATAAPIAPPPLSGRDASPTGGDGPAPDAGSRTPALERQSAASPEDPSRASGTAPPAIPVEPPLVDASGTPLPQTDEPPTVDSPVFLHHAERLFAAIVADDPSLAMPFFFPRVAYEQVKDIARPGVDWERRLVAAFERDVHEYHRALGARAAGATLVALEVPSARSEWMKPGREGNRVGYHRVLRSRLVWRDAGGRDRELEVTSLISWRGEWFVVHLHGFR